MRLSEAIRLGAMMKPQGGVCRDVDHTCALEAALDACGQPMRYELSDAMRYDLLEKLWPWTQNLVTHPVTSELMWAWLAIANLNDSQGWTRERIAAWVETIEPQDSPTATKEPACESALNVSR